MTSETAPAAREPRHGRSGNRAIVPGLLHALRAHAERPIAAARVALAASSLFAIWLDPAEPQRHVAATYSLLFTYVLYSLAILPFAWRRQRSTRLRQRSTLRRRRRSITSSLPSTGMKRIEARTRAGLRSARAIRFA